MSILSKRLKRIRSHHLRYYYVGANVQAYLWAMSEMNLKSKKESLVKGLSSLENVELINDMLKLMDRYGSVQEPKENQYQVEESINKGLQDVVNGK